MVLPEFLAWLLSKFSGKNINVNSEISLDFLKSDNSGTKATNKVKSVLKFKNKGDVYVIQVPPNPDKEVLKQLALIRKATYISGETALVAKDYRQTVQDVLLHEQNPHVASLLRFFRAKLSKHDYQLLRTGLYLKYLRNTNQKEELHKLWSKTASNSSGRAKRVVNLASAGYFETYFRPLYNQLKKEPDVQENFKKAYNEAVDEMPFAIFASKEMTTGELSELIMAKAARNIYFGVENEAINIHGTGVLVLKIIESSVEDLRLKFPRIKVKKTSGEAHIIKASVYYKTHKLTSEELDITKY